MEPLAHALREDPSTSGITLHAENFKVSLFVDNMVLYISHPRHSLLQIQTMLDALTPYIHITGEQNLHQNCFEYKWQYCGINGITES